MLYDRVDAGERLEDVVRRQYHVTDIQGEWIPGRRERVYATFEPVWRRRPELHWDAAQPGESRFAERVRLPLLDVRGVPKRDHVTQPLVIRNLLYGGLWLIGLAAGSAVGVATPWAIARLSPHLAELGDLGVYLVTRLSAAVAPAGSWLGAGPTWLAVWTAIVLAIWFVRRPVDAPHGRSRQRYLVTWLVGLAIIAAWASQLVGLLLPGAARQLLLGATFPLSAGWTVLLFNVYVQQGDDSAGYQEFVEPYRGIWASLSFVVLAIAISGFITYQSINARVSGLLAARALAAEDAHELVTHALTMRTQAARVLDDIAAYRRLVESAGPSSGDGGAPSPLQEDVRRAALAQLVADWAGLQAGTSRARAAAEAAALDVRTAIASEGQVRHVNGGGDRSETLLRPSTLPISPTLATGTAATGLTPAAELIGTSLRPAQFAVSETLRLARSVSSAVDRLDPDWADPATLAAATALEAQITTEVLTPAERAYRTAVVTERLLKGVGVEVLPTFLGTTALFAVFVLFPWVLLVLFLFRKRQSRAGTILKDLRRLDPSKGLLKRVLGLSGHLPGALDGVSLAAAATGEDGGHSPTPELANYMALLASVEELPGPRPQSLTVTETNAEHLARVVNSLAMRVFNNAEYVLSLLVLSVMVAVGWYFVLYPQTSVGLALLIVQELGVQGFSDLIRENLTPLTVGFIGAYFFIIYMLMNRYLAADLYPAAFLQAAERLAIVFILSLVLSLVVGATAQADSRLAGAAAFTAMGLSFVAGVWPREGLRQILARVQTTGRLGFLVDEQSAPLTRLDGLTMWDESRLREEQVGDIQGLATASIGDLIVRTHYPAAQIVDWIDQAVLYTHSGHDGELFSRFRAVGVRTASDLLDVVGYPLLQPGTFGHQADSPPRRSGGRLRRDGVAEPGHPEYRDREFAPDPAAVARLCLALIAAGSGPAAPCDEEPPGPREEEPEVTAPAETAAVATNGEAPGGEAPEESNGPPPESAGAASTSPVVTAALLQVICDAILPDQNMEYILNWYAWLGEPAPDEGEAGAPRDAGRP